MSKKALFKKWLKICIPLIGAPIIFSPLIAQAASKTIVTSNTEAITTFDAATTTTSPDVDADGYPTNTGATPIPSDVPDLTGVSTGVAVIKTGFETITPQEFLKGLTEPEKSSKLKEYIQPYFWVAQQNFLTGLYEAVPGGSTATYTIQNINPDNKSGSIKFECNFPTALERGAEVSNKIIKVRIPGFMKITGETKVLVNPSFPFSEIQKQTLVNSPLMLRDAIIIENLPPDVKNLVTYTPVKSTLENPNSFSVEVTVPKYYNDRAELIDSEQTYTIVLDGLSSEPNTTILVKKDANFDIYAWELNSETIKSYIQFADLPSNATMNILFDPTTDVDNKKGEITFRVELSHYWKNGIMVGTPPTTKATTDPIPPLTKTISGFKTVTESSEIRQIPGANDFYASSITTENIKNYFDISTFPLGVTFSGGTFTPDDANGTLRISNLQASLGYANDDKFSLNKPFNVPEFNISGLLRRTKTNIVVVDNDLATNKILASDVTSFMILDKYVTITNLPPLATTKVVDLKHDNLTGTVSFKLEFSVVYNEDGNLVKGFLSDPYTIHNFLPTKTSTIKQKEGVDLTKVHVSDLDETNIKEYVDFSSFPTGTLFYQYVFSDINNTTGTGNFSVTASSWYDDAGNLMPASGTTEVEKTFTIPLTGFAIQMPTTIKENPLINNSGTLASSIKTTDQIKGLFTIENISEDAEYPTKFTATNFKANNLKGELTFTLIINNYYDEKGIFNNVRDSNYEPMIKEYTFKNYKVVSASSVTQIAEPKTLLPTDFGEPSTIPLIHTYIDTSTFPETASFSYEVTNPINKLGTCDLAVTATQWYDKTGELVKTPNRFMVHLVGCKTQQPTRVIQNTSFDVSKLVASDIDNITELAKLIVFQNPYDHAPVPVTDWSATNFHYKNSEGKLSVDIRLDQYYDTNGNPVKPGSDNYQPMLETIELIGFKKTTKSVLKQKFNPIASETLPTTVKSKNNWQDFVDFSTFPDDVQIISANLYPIDKTGTLTINATIKNYYNEAGNIDNNQQLFSIELSGFKEQTEVTTISAIANKDENLETSYAIDLIEKNPTEFFNKYIKITGEVPGTVKTVPTYFWDNSKGILTVSIKLDKFYDSNGNIMTEAENKGVGLLKTLEIAGFKRNQKTEVNQNPAFINSDMTASDFCNEFNAMSSVDQENKFKQVTKITSPVDGAKYNSFSLTPINIDGIVLVNYIASKVYNANGDIITNQQGNITLKNFKVEMPSKLVEVKSIDKDYPATDLVIDNKNFWDFFDKTKFPAGTEPTNISSIYYNNEGRIDVFADMPSYFDLNGNLINSPRPFNASIYGFQKITSESVLRPKAKPTAPGLFNSTPREVINSRSNKGELQTLFDDLVDTSLFPQMNTTLGTTGTTFDVSYVSGDNIEGTIEFVVSANKYYGGENNNLYDVVTGKKVKIGGFRKELPSTISVKNPNTLPSELTYNDLIFNNFKNTPDEKDVSFRNMDDDTGKVTIVIKNCYFYDKEGILREKNQFQTTITIGVTPPPDMTPLILGLSLGIGIPAVGISGFYGWRKWYKKTHEV